jgi:O-antigen ligase
MGISVLWSDFPEVSFRRWVRSLGDIIMVLIVITEINHTGAVLKLFRSMAYVLIPISIIFIKYYRNLGVTYDETGAFEMWVGVTTHKNSLGQLACVSAAVLVWTFFSKYYKSKLLDIPVLLIALFLLNGSKTSLSRTSFGVFIFAMVILFILKLLKNRVNVIRTFTCILIPTIIIINLLTNYLYSKDIMTMVILSTGGDPTLTGRTPLWDAILQIASHHQLLGAGYGGFWIGNLGNNLWDTFNWKPGAAHNGYIDVYVDLGLIGVTILLFLIIFAYRDILKNIAYNSDFGKFRMMMFVMILVYNYTESSFFKPTALLWFSYLIISIRVPELFPEERYKKVNVKKNILKK